MDLSALKQTIEHGALAAELERHVKEANDSETAAILNRRDQPGYVPRRHVAVSFARFPTVYALARWVTRFGKTPDGEQNMPLFGLFAAILLVVDSDCDLKAGIADLADGLKDIPMEVVPQEFRDYLFAGEVKISYAESVGLVPIGGEVTARDCGGAR